MNKIIEYRQIMYAFSAIVVFTFVMGLLYVTLHAQEETYIIAKQKTQTQITNNTSIADKIKIIEFNFNINYYGNKLWCMRELYKEFNLST